MPPILKPCLPYIPGETGASYASRLAALFHKSPRDYCSDLGMRWPFLCSGKADQLDRLAMLSGESKDQITLFSPQKLGIGRYRVGKTTSGSGVFRRTRIRLCAACVSEAFSELGDPGIFQLLEWSVLCLPLCRKHNMPLIELPKAETSHQAYDVVTMAKQSWDLIRKSCDQDSINVPTAFEHYTLSRIYNGRQNDWLKEMDLTELSRACSTLGSAIHNLDHKETAKLSLQDHRELRQDGFDVLIRGQDALHRQFDQLKTNYRSDRPYFSSDMGEFYHWLRCACRNGRLPAFTKVTRDYIFATYPVNRGQKVLGAKAPATKLLTMEEARKRSNLGTKFMKRVLAHVKGKPGSAYETLTDISVQDLEEVCTFWKSVLNVKDAASLLGLYPAHIKAAIATGALRHISFGSSLQYVPREEIETCLSEFRSLPLRQPSSSFLSLNNFCRVKGIPLAKVISEWRFGRLDGLLCRFGGKDLRQIGVRQDAMCSRWEMSLARDLTLRETANYLKISVISIRKIRDASLLNQIRKRNPDTMHQRNYISKSSIGQFEKRFITLGQLARDTGREARHLARALDRDDINPTDLIDGEVRVYERRNLPTAIFSMSAEC